MMAELAARRRALGLTLTDAARKLKVGASSLSRYERGVRIAPEDFRKSYNSLLLSCERGRHKYPKSRKRVSGWNMHTSLNMEEWVVPAEVQVLRKKIRRLRLSYVILRDITGFGIKSLKSRFVKGYPLVSEDYTVIVNAIYDLEQGGLYQPMDPNARTYITIMLKYFRARMHKLTALREKYAKLSEELSVQGQAYGGFRPSTGSHADPVANHYARMEKVKQKIEYYRSLVEPILEVTAKLKNSKSERARVIFILFERHFQNGESISAIASSLGIPGRTLYRRMLELQGLVWREWKGEK